MIKNLDDRTLLSKTDSLVREERELLTKLLHHLREIERRRLFADFGYKSLYDMLVKKYGYSEDQAYRRISAMRLLAELPEIEAKINQGDLNLSHLGLAQTLFRQERKTHQTEVPKIDKLKVLESFARTTTREAERIAFSFSSAPEMLQSGRIRAVSEDQIEMRFVASLATQEKIETLKGWLAHKSPNVQLGELFEMLCDLALAEWDPRKPAAPRKQRVQARRALTTEDQPRVRRSNSIAGLRREIFRGAGNVCEKCGSQHALEIDHVRPRAVGGDSTRENLRLLCRACNQRAAIRNLGLRKMNPFLNR